MGPFQGHPLNQKEILSYSNQLALIRTTSSFCGLGEGVDGGHGVEDVQEDKVKDMEEGLVENLEEVLEEFGQSPQKPCPKPIGPFQGHP